MSQSRLLRIVATILICIGSLGGIQASRAAPVQTPTMTTTSIPLSSQSFPGPPCLPPSQADISTAQLPPAGQNVSIPGHIVPRVRAGNAVQKGNLPTSRTLRLELVFALRKEASFEQCLASLTDPTAPNFGHFLDATTLEPYLPTPGQKQSMADFMQKVGFTVSFGASPIVIELMGNADVISRAFGIQLKLYVQGSGSFYSPDSEPTLPQNLGQLTNAIMGLDNFSSVQPAETPCGLLGNPYCPQSVQVGYGLSNLFNSGYNGAGQTVAVVDAPGDPNIQGAINIYNTQYGLPSIALDLQYPDGPPSSYDSGWATETAMDVEAVHSIAPGAGIVVLYDADVMDAVDYVATHNLAKIVSNSWVYTCAGPSVCSDTQLPSSTVSTVHSRLAIDAAQGLTILFGSGDQGAKPDGSNLGTEFPASDPNVLAVGATNLNLAGCGINTCSGYGSETGASISGGGYSGHFAEPNWQTLNIGSKPGRAVPDVSMLGGNDAVGGMGFWVYSTASDKCTGDGTNHGAGWFGCAGTSLSTPLWAGLLAVALQVRGGGEFGNISPLLYQLGHGSAYSTDFHDVTSGSSNGYSAATGWDPVTGWGTPIANTLAYDLSHIVVTTTQVVTSTGTTAVTSYTTTTHTSFTSTSVSTSTIQTVTTVILVQSTATSVVQSIQYLTSILNSTVTSYTSTYTSTSTIPTVTTVTVGPSTATSTVQTTQTLISTGGTTITDYTTTTVTNYTATVTSTGTSIVNTTVTVSSGTAYASLVFFSFLSLVAMTAGLRAVAAMGTEISNVRSRIGGRCSRI